MINQEKKELIPDENINKKHKLDLKKEIIDWINSLLLAFVVSLFLIKYIVFIGTVPTGSMIPTINIGDRILICKFFMYLDKDNKGLTYGDLVVFKGKELNGFKENQLLVKRVIGLSGDKIKIEEGIVYRNNKKLEEPYVKNKSVDFMDEIVVPEGELFVLGDNRLNSNDSRYWIEQTFRMSDVVGEVLLP